MPAQIDAVGIDRFLAGKLKGGGQDVVDFAQKGLLGAWVVVASAQRGEHEDDPRFAVGTGSLVVVGRGLCSTMDRVPFMRHNHDALGRLKVGRFAKNG
jgi:hypothetical protein